MTPEPPSAPSRTQPLDTKLSQVRFHALFRQYYNLRALLRRIDPDLQSLVQSRTTRRTRGSCWLETAYAATFQSHSWSAPQRQDSLLFGCVGIGSEGSGRSAQQSSPVASPLWILRQVLVDPVFSQRCAQLGQLGAVDNINALPLPGGFAGYGGLHELDVLVRQAEREGNAAEF
jgi:hypothetical protein